MCGTGGLALVARLGQRGGTWWHWLAFSRGVPIQYVVIRLVVTPPTYTDYTHHRPALVWRRTYGFQGGRRGTCIHPSFLYMEDVLYCMRGTYATRCLWWKCLVSGLALECLNFGMAGLELATIDLRRPCPWKELVLSKGAWFYWLHLHPPRVFGWFLPYFPLSLRRLCFFLLLFARSGHAVFICST